jgi:hypothetical protein
MYLIDRTSIASFCKAIGKTALLTKSLRNKKDVRDAVFDVYQSPRIIARVMHGRANINVVPILDYIAEKLYSYLNDEPDTILNQTNYDNFIYNLCEYFKNEYNKEAKIAEVCEIEFGIAQKLINMIFKYLSCYEDYVGFADIFKYCHMPIDSYVLHYFNDMRIVSSIVSYYSAHAVSPYASYHSSSWSKMDRALYERLVDEYRKNLGILYPDYTWLHQEYYIWELVKMRKIGPIKFNLSILLPGTITRFKA